MTSIRRLSTIMGMRRSARPQILPESVSWRVANSWKLLENDLEEVGIDFFFRLFDEQPFLLELFQFGGNTLSRDNMPRALRMHALNVMNLIGQCVSGTEDIENVIPRLRAVGQTHLRAGVQDRYYDLMFKSLIDAIAHHLGPEQFDRATMEAWSIVFRSVTSIFKRPDDTRIQIEPLQGWGAVNGVACAYFTFVVPFRMAGFAARSNGAENLLTFFASLAALCLLLDLCSSSISKYVKRSTSTTTADWSKKSLFRKSMRKRSFPLRLRIRRFLRSIDMDQWSSWPRMDAIVLLSFPFQYADRWYSDRRHAGVHWTFLFGLFRMTAAVRLVHFLACAENNLMLRRRVNENERNAIRVGKLLIALTSVIHLAACLWCIVARVELGPHVATPQPSEFFPNSDILLGGRGILNAYLHAVHWAWVNLSGIGDCASNPVTSFECFYTLLVHICGASLYTIVTGNVVAMLELLTRKQNAIGDDLSSLGNFMTSCSVPPMQQKQVLQAYMMQTVIRDNIDDEDDELSLDRNLPNVPDAVSRLPSYLQKEMSTYARAEAIKRRDPAFAHCSNEFLFVIVGALGTRKFLLAGDFFIREQDTVPRRVIVIESGTMEVLSEGKCSRLLGRGDVIGKRWLLSAVGGSEDEKKPTFHAQTSLRALTDCTLDMGLGDFDQIAELHERYPRELALLKADREQVNAARNARAKEESRRVTFKEAATKVKNALRVAKKSGN